MVTTPKYIKEIKKETKSLLQDIYQLICFKFHLIAVSIGLYSSITNRFGGLDLRSRSQMDETKHS